MGRGGKRGRGGGGGRGGRGEGGGFEDQYGDAGMSQDRDEHMGFSSRGGASGGRMGGGGDAGDLEATGVAAIGREPSFRYFTAVNDHVLHSTNSCERCHAGGGRHGSNVNFIRHVPKFLQGHMHLLGKPQDSTEEQLTAKKAAPDTWDSEEDDEAERQVGTPPLDADQFLLPAQFLGFRHCPKPCEIAKVCIKIALVYVACAMSVTLCLALSRMRCRGR